MQSYLGIIDFTIATPQESALYPVSTVNAFVLYSQLMQLKLICHNLIVIQAEYKWLIHHSVQSLHVLCVGFSSHFLRHWYFLI